MRQDLETRPSESHDTPVRVTFFFDPRNLFRTYIELGEDETRTLISALVTDQFAAVKGQLIETIYEAVAETQAMIDRT